MKTLLMFPGQASQFVGMGKALYDENERARAVMDMAEEITGLPIKMMCFEGPENLLTRTDNAQPCIVACSLAALSAWEGGFHFTTGHSLGEYSALAAAGAISYEDALRLVKRRGELMAKADEARPGAMAAVVGLNEATIKEALAEAGGTVIIANINSPDQIVISGETDAVTRAGEILSQRGAKRVIPLKVSAAFHSPLMEPASEELRPDIEATEFRTPRVPVIPCATAKATNEPTELKKALLVQLLSPVRWTDMLTEARNQGAERFLEMGPGKVLQGLAKRTIPDATIEGFGS
ncbi:MAG: ACP S-malonyltransferase [candidate division WOR-3 bacterium]